LIDSRAKSSVLASQFVLTPASAYFVPSRGSAPSPWEKEAMPHRGQGLASTRTRIFPWREAISISAPVAIP
jgi:hypothetical protein